MATQRGHGTECRADDTMPLSPVERSLVMRILTGHKQAIRALAYAPDGRILASAGDERLVFLWDPLTGTEAAPPIDARARVFALAYAPIGLRLAYGGGTGEVYLRDLTRRGEWQPRVRVTGAVVMLWFTLDGRALLGATRRADPWANPPRDLLFCWNLDPHHPVEWIDGPGPLETVAFAPSHHLVAFASKDRAVYVWEVARPVPVEPLLRVPAKIGAMGFMPGERRRLAVASGRVVQMQDLDDPDATVTFAGHRGDVRCLAFSADGSRLVTGAIDRSVRLWDTATGQQLGAWEWKIGVINAVAVAPDGMTAACGGDPQVVVWDLD